MAAFKDESGDIYLPDAADHAEALEERDYYTMANVFWVPASARWNVLRAQAKQADIGVRIDAALEAIEADNPRLKGIIDKRFGRTQLEPGRVGNRMRCPVPKQSTRAGWNRTEVRMKLSQW